ncbi:hypothetical protein LK06_029010 [Streptomyces pluripotens]|nr:hypothetical protein LK06_029010 [Streptomyces pluripotens]
MSRSGGGPIRPVWPGQAELVGEAVAGLAEQDGARGWVIGQRQQRTELGGSVSGVPEADLDAETVDTEGRFYQPLLNDLVIQRLFDPDSATTADRLTEGLRRDRARCGIMKPWC